MASHDSARGLTPSKCAITIVVALSLAALVFGSRAIADSVVSYKTNAAGMTYGSAADAPSLEAEPDLIQAVATNGKTGYVKKTELDAASQPARDPDEAVAMMRERSDTQCAAFCESLSAQSSAYSAQIAAFQAEDGKLFSEMMNRVDETLSFETVAEEFNLDPADLETACLAARESTSRHIPVYELDGETIIGDFIVG